MPQGHYAALGLSTAPPMAMDSCRKSEVNLFTPILFNSSTDCGLFNYYKSLQNVTQTARFEPFSSPCLFSRGAAPLLLIVV